MSRPSGKRQWHVDANPGSQAIGGFKGEPQDAPSGVNQKEKLRLLKGEGVVFDKSGFLVDVERWWNDFKA